MGNVIQKDNIVGFTQCNHLTGDEHFRILFMMGPEEVSIRIPPIVDIDESTISDIQLRMEHGDSFRGETINLIVQKIHTTGDVMMRISDGFLIIELSDELSRVKININKHRKMVIALLEYVQGNHNMEIEYNTRLISSLNL